MNWFHRLIAIVVLGLFSVQTFALTPSNQTSNQASSEDTVFFKAVISATSLLAEVGTKKLILDHTGFQDGNTLDILFTSESVLARHKINQACLNQYNLYKADILSSVNLIFPFQYFW